MGMKIQVRPHFNPITILEIRCEIKAISEALVVPRPFAQMKMNVTMSFIKALVDIRLESVSVSGLRSKLKQSESAVVLSSL